MFRVTHRGDKIGHAGTIEDARQIVEGQPPGRYDVDEFPGGPFPHGAKWMAWGHLIRHPDGQLEYDAWPRPFKHPGSLGTSRPRNPDDEGSKGMGWERRKSSLREHDYRREDGWMLRFEDEPVRRWVLCSLDSRMAWDNRKLEPGQVDEAQAWADEVLAGKPEEGPNLRWVRANKSV
jgi:hypothetical protein